MSELKSYNSERIYWAVEQVEQEAGDIEDLHLDDNLFYIKSEADKVIAELTHNGEKKLIKQTILRVWAEMQLRHNKYERCLANAKYWIAVSYQCVDDKHHKIAEKRHYKWLKLSENFKEANK